MDDKDILTCTKNKLFATVSSYEEYDMTFDIKPTGTRGAWANIIHATTHNDNNYHAPGRRIPGIWFYANTTKMHVRQARPGAGNDGCDSCAPLAMNAWSKVGLKLEGNTLSVSVNDKVCCTNHKYAHKEEGHKDVMVYVSDPWYDAASAQVKDFNYADVHAPKPTPKPTPAVDTQATETEKMNCT
jgi:hypothetical protein